MFSLRAKIILSLISMSMLAVALGGASARTIMLTRFSQVINERATVGFVREAAGYYDAYGSWDDALEAETFFSFAARNFSAAAGTGQVDPNRGQLGPPPGVGATPGIPGQMLPLPADRMLPPPEQMPQGQRRLADFDGPAPPIVATDLEGIVRIPTPIYAPGTQVPDSVLKNAAPIMSGEEQIGYAFSTERIALSSLEIQYLESLKDSWWLTFLLVLATAVPIGIVQGRRLAAPINNLSTAMLSMQPESIEQSVPVTSGDELGKLAENFNRMSTDLSAYVEVIQSQKERITETEALRKEGLASISHEIRTPLNTSVAQANAMLEGIRPLDSEQMQKLSSTLDHMTKLVDDLFQLSLADVNALECETQPTEFCELILEAADAAKSKLSERNISLDLRLPEHMQVIGDATRLRQIVDNLLENCVRYTSADGEVRVQLKPSGEFAELTISDSGPGVTDKQLESLFDRFFRADISRSRETGGSGLGLSLVKVWTEIQSGTVKAFQSAEGGLGIAVTIPLLAHEK